MTVIIPSSTPNYGFTAQEMTDQVSDELRNVSIASKILRWINLSIIELGSEYIFGELNKYGEIIVVPSIADYLLQPDLHWLSNVQHPVNNRKIYPYPGGEVGLSEDDPNYRTLQGTITFYYLNGITIGFRHVPSSVQTLTYNYQKRPLKLINGTDTSDLPAEWHPLIMQRAITYGCRYEGNTDARIASETREAFLLKRLGAIIYKRPDERIVMGKNRSRGRKPAEPRLPSNFPERY